MKLSFLSLLVWCVAACAGPITEYTVSGSVRSDGCGDLFSVRKAVFSNATFYIYFNGLDQIYPPEFPQQRFTVEIPVRVTVTGSQYLAGADVDITARQYHWSRPSDGYGPQWDIEFVYLPISQLEPFVLDITIREGLSASSRG